MTALIITGDKHVDRNMAKLTGPEQKKIIRKATRDGAKIILADARKYVPIDQGELQKAMRVRTAKGRNGRRLRKGTFGHAVAIPDTQFYARLLEFGTKPRSTKSGAYRGVVQPVEFLREALYVNHRRVVRRTISVMRHWLRTIR